MPGWPSYQWQSRVGGLMPQPHPPSAATTLRLVPHSCSPQLVEPPLPRSETCSLTPPMLAAFPSSMRPGTSSITQSSPEKQLIKYEWRERERCTGSHGYGGRQV